MTSPGPDFSISPLRSATSSPSVREIGMLCGIVGLALLLRLSNLQQIYANDPFFELPAVDPLFYREWAIGIANGDIWGDGVFLQGPLYPYLLGALYGVFGPGFLLPLLLQCLLGAASCVLVWALARRLFGVKAALLSAGMASVYAMSIFYEGNLLIANILPALALVVLLTALHFMESPTQTRAMALGFTIGLSTLARPNMLLYVAFAAIWIVWMLRPTEHKNRAASMVVALGIGVAVCLLPSLLRNRIVANDWVIVSASAGMNFFNGNNPDANGVHRVPSIFDRSQADTPDEQNRVYRAVAERDRGRALRASEVSRYWWGRGLAYARHDTADWLQLLGRKFLLFTNAMEPWNNRSFEVSRQFSWVLDLPLLTFGVVAPFAFLGIAVTLGRWRELLPLYGVVGVYLVSCVIFFMLSRYRMPVMPIFFVFAGGAGIWSWEMFHARNVARLTVASIALVGFACWVHIDVLKDDLSVAYYNLGNKYRVLQEYERAIEEYDRSLRIDESFISAYNNRAIALEKSDREPAQAIRAWKHVLFLGQKRRLYVYIERAERHLRELKGSDASASPEP